MTSVSGRFFSADGLSLHHRTVLAEAGRPALVFVHGVGEHIGRYAGPFNWFAGRGYGCFGFDQRGFGRSEGRRGHVADFSLYLSDLATFVERVVLPATPGPILLFGHSMGSIVALCAALRGEPAIAGLLIFSCPITLAQRSGKLGGLLAESLHRWIPEWRLPNLIGPDSLTNDPAAVQAYRDDPLVYGKVSTSWLHQFGLACQRIRREAAAITCPVLFAHGGSDPIADISGARWLYEHVGSSDKTLEIFAGFRHELLNHLPADRERVLGCAGGWLASRFGR